MTIPITAPHPPAFACNLKAIGTADRPRYNQLRKLLRESVQARTELPNGYDFKLNAKSITLPEAAEWIAMERQCCPFLTLQITATGNRQTWSLTLTGPTGVKALLQTEFK